MSNQLTSTIGSALSSSKVEYTPTQLIFPENTSIEEWRDVGKKLQRIDQLTKWWVGDWLAFGAKKYGSKVKQLKELTGYADHSLWNAATVSRAVSPETRRMDLPWSHHAEVTTLPPADQAEWLSKAAKETLSVRDLRQQIRKSQATQDATKPDHPGWDSPVKKTRDLKRWLESKEPDFWEDKQIVTNWMEHLRPLVEFYNTLKLRQSGQ